MIQLNYIYGQSVVGRGIDIVNLSEKLKNHKMILNSQIMEYYSDSIKDSAVKSFVIDMISKVAISENGSLLVNFNQDKAVEENIVDILNNIPDSYLINGDDDSFSLYPDYKSKKEVKLDDLNSTKSPFYKYCLPIVSHNVDENEKCEIYSEWFKNLFKNEKEITIIDQYIFNGNGYPSLKKWYLPIIDEKSNIKIYTNLKSDKINAEELLNNNAGRNIDIYNCKKMHDRWILADDFSMTIGQGLDFMLENGQTQKTSFTVNEGKNISTIPENAEEFIPESTVCEYVSEEER